MSLTPVKIADKLKHVRSIAGTDPGALSICNELIKHFETQSNLDSPCYWYVKTDRKEGDWETSCEEEFHVINELLPSESSIKFCPNCGKKVVEKTLR